MIIFLIIILLSGYPHISGFFKIYYLISGYFKTSDNWKPYIQTNRPIVFVVLTDIFLRFLLPKIIWIIIKKRHICVMQRTY